MQRRRAAGFERIKYIAGALSAAGSPGLQSKRVITGERIGRFGRRVAEYSEFGPAWPVGKHDWQVVYSSKDGDSTGVIGLESAVVPSGEVVVFEHRSYGKPMGLNAWNASETIATSLAQFASAHRVTI